MTGGIILVLAFSRRNDKEEPVMIILNHSHLNLGYLCGAGCSHTAYTADVFPYGGSRFHQDFEVYPDHQGEMIRSDPKAMEEIGVHSRRGINHHEIRAWKDYAPNEGGSRISMIMQSNTELVLYALILGGLVKVLKA